MRPCFLTATDLLQKYRSGDLSPVEVIEDVLSRIDELNSTYNAYCFVQDRDKLLQEARESEARYKNLRSGQASSSGERPGLLDGVPVSVKDILTVRGMKRTNFGSIAWKRQMDELGVSVDDIDSPSVQRLREARAIIVGKVTSPEFGWQGVTKSPLLGITRNPIDPQYTSGGSSGGSSAAVALGMGPLSLGTDAGGSVRIPAAFCGISTIKATFARVAHAPPSAFGTLSHVGPMATSIEDVSLMLDVIAQPHLMDPYSLFPGMPDREPFVTNTFSKSLRDGVRGMKIAFSINLGGYVPYVDPRIEEKVRGAAVVFEKLGAKVEFVDDLRDPSSGEYVLPFRNEQFVNLYRTFKSLWCVGAANLLQMKIHAEHVDQVDPGLREISTLGERFTAVQGAKAEFERTTMARAMNKFHEKYDLLCTPTLPLPPFKAEWEVPEHDDRFMKGRVAAQDSSSKEDETTFRNEDRQRWWIWTPFTYPFNLTRQPAASVPCGFFDSHDIEHKRDVDNGYMDSFPIGLQIVSRPYHEHKILQAAFAFEKQTEHQKRIMSRIHK